MDRDPASQDDRPTTYDDARIGTIVRAVADEWRRPPQRLDQPTWRERVASEPRWSRRSGGRGWFGRLAGAATLAVVATVVLALAAVNLTSTRPDRGVVGASPSQGSAPSPSARGSAPTVVVTPLPALVVHGALPSVTNVLVQGGGGYQFADLATGTLGSPLPWSVGGSSSVLARPGGGWVCVCVTYRGGSGGPPTSIAIALESIDRSGKPDGHADLPAVTSEIAPGAPAAPDATQVDVHADRSPDGRFAYVGHTHRTVSGWRAGFDVVDLTTLQIVDKITVPDVDHATEAGPRSWVQLAPKVSMRLDGDVFLISSDWYVDDSTTSAPPYGTDRWSATFDGKTPVAISSAEQTSGDGCGQLDQGLIDDETFYAVCISQAGNVRVDRIRLDGTLEDQTEVGRSTGFLAMALRSGTQLYLWDPQAHTLVRHDLVTGASFTLPVPDTGGLQERLDPVAALGRALGDWIAPTAAAKIWLQPAIAISPDGQTLYAIGINGSIESAGSAGLFAFDIGRDVPTLKGHWDPTADFISIAVSSDGAFVYAAAMGGVDAQGNQVPDFKGSVTVYDATDGSIRLIAGQLSDHDLMFVEPVVR
jgi:hypothetical protein